MPGSGASERTNRSDPIRVIGRQGVGDRHPGIGPVDREPLVAELVHQRSEVVRDGGGVVAVLGLVRQPHAALVDCDHLEVVGQRRHHHPPRGFESRAGCAPFTHRARASESQLQAPRNPIGHDHLRP